MLKMGIYLLAASIVGVIYRFMGLIYSGHPYLKWFTFSGLCMSLSCFAGFYCFYKVASLQKSLLSEI